MKYRNTNIEILEQTALGIEKVFSCENGINDWKRSLNFKWIVGSYMAAVLSNNHKTAAKIERILLDELKEKELGTFIPFQMAILLHLPVEISDEMKELCKYVLKESRAFNIASCWDFIGVNDNTPAMIMTCLFLYAQMFQDDECRNIAEKRLIQFEQMIKERRFLSEYNTSTYLAISIAAFAALAEFSCSDDIKKRAIYCEEQLWKMTFDMYHKYMCVLAGPYGRAYEPNTYMQHSQTSALLYIILGERMKNNPIKEYFTYDSLNIDDVIAEKCPMWGEISWLAAISYHCPEKITIDALNAKYPIFVEGDAQISASADDYLIEDKTDSNFEFYHLSLSEDKEEVIRRLSEQEDVFEYPAGVARIFSYKDRYYSLGTSTKEFHNGIQSDSFHVGICEKENVETQDDISTIFARYIVNNDEDTRYDIYGRKLAFQDKNTAVVCYTPKIVNNEINSLKLSVLIHSAINSYEIYHKNKRVCVNDEFYADGPIFLRFKYVTASITVPIKKKVRIERIKNCVAISIIDYEGEGKHFPKKSLKLINAGFAFEIADLFECKREEFEEKVNGSIYNDEICTNFHFRYALEREAYYLTKETFLECRYSPITEGIRYLRINGKTVI